MELEDYIDSFADLQRKLTKGVRAPHKPLLLLSIIHLFSKDIICDNNIVVDSRLKNVFSQLWNKIIENKSEIVSVYSPNIIFPMWRMQRELFWHIVPKNEYKYSFSTLIKNNREPTTEEYNQYVDHVELDNDLAFLLTLDFARERLTEVLLSTYFKISLAYYHEIEDSIDDSSNTDCSNYTKKSLSSSNSESTFLKHHEIGSINTGIDKSSNISTPLQELDLLMELLEKYNLPISNALGYAIYKCREKFSNSKKSTTTTSDRTIANESNKSVILTQQMIESGRLVHKGFCKEQLDAIGVSIPLSPNWENNVIGKVFTPEQVHILLGYKVGRWVHVIPGTENVIQPTRTLSIKEDKTTQEDIPTKESILLNILSKFDEPVPVYRLIKFINRRTWGSNLKSYEISKILQSMPNVLNVNDMFITKDKYVSSHSIGDTRNSGQSNTATKDSNTETYSSLYSSYPPTIETVFSRFNTLSVDGKQAPNKAILFIAILKLMNKGIITGNRIFLTNNLHEEFNAVRKQFEYSDYFNPKFYDTLIEMQKEPYWTFIRKSSIDNSSIQTQKDLEQKVMYARLSEKVYNLLADVKSRDACIKFLLDHYTYQ